MFNEWNCSSLGIVQAKTWQRLQKQIRQPLEGATIRNTLLEINCRFSRQSASIGSPLLLKYIRLHLHYICITFALHLHLHLHLHLYLHLHCICICICTAYKIWKKAFFSIFISSKDNRICTQKKACYYYYNPFVLFQ